MIEQLPRGQVRTYAYANGTIPILCERQSILVIAGMAQLTRWTILDMPGARDTLIPPLILAVMDDITALRIVAQEDPWNAEAQRDVIAADLDQHLQACARELNRHVLFGAYQAPEAPHELDIDPCGFGGADVAMLRSKSRTKLLRDSWLAMVVVPPQIGRCSLVTPLEPRY